MPFLPLSGWCSPSGRGSIAYTDVACSISIMYCAAWGNWQMGDAWPLLRTWGRMQRPEKPCQMIALPIVASKGPGHGHSRVTRPSISSSFPAARVAKHVRAVGGVGAYVLHLLCFELSKSPAKPREQLPFVWCSVRGGANSGEWFRRGNDGTKMESAAPAEVSMKRERER
jgi:hypothetical protein